MAAKTTKPRPGQTQNSSSVTASSAPVDAADDGRNHAHRPVVADPGDTLNQDLTALIAGELCEGQDEMTLDEDPDTSIVTSLFIHLMSEHYLVHALDMGEEAAATCHQAQHDVRPQKHDLDDLRFRPGRAMTGLIMAQKERAARAATVADVPTQNQRV